MGGTYWYVREPDEVLDDLNSSLQGISSKEAQKRLHQYGPNSIANEVRFQLLRNIWEKSNNLLIYILLAAGVISLFAGHMLEFVVIGIIVVITVIMGVVQEHSAGKAITALKQLTAREVWVVRDGKRIQIAAQQLVPGDIVVLDRGMLVPADMRILTTEGLLVDESILHGEPIPKYKVTDALSHQNIPVTDQDNMVFSGTSVTNGQGVGVVVASGLSTELGKISVQLRQLSKQKSPLQKKLDVMTTRISVSVLVVCVILLILLLNADVELAYALLLVAAVAVSGIPESLPLALTVALSSGVRRMAKNHAIIRDLSSVETLGTTTVICTDKTGTLTENKMRVAQAIVGGVHYSVNGKGYEPIGVFSVGDKRVAKESLTTHDEFVQACVLCNNAEIYNHQDDWLLRGEPTEGALLTLAKSSGVDEAVMRERWKRLHVIPFDPLHKFMVTVHRSASKKTNAYLKGAVERVLDRCTHIRKVGKLVVLDARQRKAVHAQVDALSGAALRVLGVASKKLPPKWSTRQSSQLNGGYIFEGLVGMEDPIREEVYDSVKECKSAGVRIIMITGDHRKTAESIARRLGIMGGHDVVLTGGEIEQMTDSELDAQLRHVAVVARATPEHKLRIVSGLQRQGEITAMTGDGVNDAPALKKADIGVAMGKTGTDVARQSANMVLADDSFKSIVKAIEEGRTIYSNIRRFIFYLLTGSIAKVALMLAALMLGLGIPLTALMILFINLVNSSLPAFALSVEPTHPKVMRQKPRPAHERLLSEYLMIKILVMVPVMFLGTLLVYIWKIGVEGGSLPYVQTMVFATVVLFELFHALNARSLNLSVFSQGLFTNRYLLNSVLLSLCMVLLAIYTPQGQSIFSTVGLSVGDWGVVLLVSVSILFVSELIKLLVKNEMEELRAVKGFDLTIE